MIVESDPKYGPVYLTKIDVADRFYYRVWVQVRDIPKLGVLLVPTSPGQQFLVAFPLALPIALGWVELPPYFIC